MQKICYDRGGILKGLTPVALPPVNPRQALTRLEGIPDNHQYSGVSWGSHRLLDDVSLHTASHCFDLESHTEGRPPVKRSTYDERDYAFGQMVLTLRTNLGLTQAGLAAEGRPHCCQS